MARFLVAVFALIAFGFAPAQAAEGSSAHIKAKLIAESATVAKGGEVWAAIDYTPAPGWHTYWINPGDTGLAPRVTWSLPDGMAAGDLQFPTPVLLPTLNLMSYGYEGRTVLLVRLKNGSALGSGETLPLKAHVDFLVCADVCVPESLDVSTALKVGPAQSGPDAKTVAKALKVLPKPVAITATIAINNGTAELGFAAPKDSGLLSRPQGAYFFVAQDKVLNPETAQELDVGADGFTLRTKAAGTALPDGPLSGVLKFGDGSAYAVTLMRAPLASGVHGLGSAAAEKTDTSLGGVLVAMGLAFLGGLILNLMPCVFPVLSMKLLSLAKANEGQAEARTEALMYGAGAVLSFVALALLLQLAHALGASLGWGFQLQSPYVVAALALIMLLVALNMSGAFEIGASLQGVGAGALDRKRPLLSAFLTGVLAVIVAAPCTAPFMATAIGVALAQGGVTSFAIFVALGLGFALPFVALTFLITAVPAIARALPKPGTWMTGIKIVLSLLMYAAAVWLVWVFAQQVGLTGALLLAAALALVSVAVAPIKLPKAFRLVGAVLAVMLGLFATQQKLSPLAPVSDQATVADGHAVFNLERLTAERAAGHPVLVDLTAAWCVTCKVNEMRVLTTPEVAAAMKATGTVYMIGDWTNQDPEISRYLNLFGRSGVPLYVYYGAHNAEPVVLPQILETKAVVKILRDDGAK